MFHDIECIGKEDEDFSEDTIFWELGYFRQEALVKVTSFFGRFEQGRGVG